MSRERVTPAWISWIAGVVLSSVTVGLVSMLFLFSHFETAANADKRETHIMDVQKTDRDRLIRIEDKLDRVIDALK